jgi:hypothetical protein
MKSMKIVKRLSGSPSAYNDYDFATVDCDKSRAEEIAQALTDYYYNSERFGFSKTDHSEFIVIESE